MSILPHSHLLTRPLFRSAVSPEAVGPTVGPGQVDLLLHEVVAASPRRPETGAIQGGVTAEIQTDTHSGEGLRAVGIGIVNMLYRQVFQPLRHQNDSRRKCRSYNCDRISKPPIFG